MNREFCACFEMSDGTSLLIYAFLHLFSIWEYLQYWKPTNTRNIEVLRDVTMTKFRNIAYNVCHVGHSTFQRMIYCQWKMKSTQSHIEYWESIVRLWSVWQTYVISINFSVGYTENGACAGKQFSLELNIICKK